MNVEIGPVSADSAAAWIRYGRAVLTGLDATARASLPEHALDRFSLLLDQWQEVPTDRPFHWLEEQPEEEVEFLMKALYEIGLVVEREHDAGRMELRPAEADEFHRMIVRQILAEIELEGPAPAQFVEAIREEWGVAGDV